VQIPAEYIEALGIKDKRKVRMKLDGGRITMDPPES